MSVEQNWKNKYEALAEAVKQVPSFSTHYGEALKGGLTEHTMIIKESVIYDIQQALK